LARSNIEIRNSLIDGLVSVAATIGITIDPTKWKSVPGDLSQTDQKLLLLDAVASGQAIEEQINDAFVLDVETLLNIIPPQTPAWFQNRAINIFQFSISSPQLPSISNQQVTIGASVVVVNGTTYLQGGNTYSILYQGFIQIIPSLRPIKYCTVKFGSFGRCLIKVAGQIAGLPVDLDTAAGAGCLNAYNAFVIFDSAPGINYVVTSGPSDKLFLQIDVYYNGVFSSVIFSAVQTAITNFLNSIPFDGNMKLSLLEEAILAVSGVTDVVFVNVGARADSGSISNNLVGGGTFDSGGNTLTNGTELARSWDTISGYMQLEGNAGFTLSDFRVGSSGKLNLNCIAN